MSAVIQSSSTEWKQYPDLRSDLPNEQSAEMLAMAVLLRVSEDWAERRYLDMTPLHALYPQLTGFAT